MRIIIITGESGSGKTRLIEQMIPLLTKRGLRIGAIKHTHQQFEIDREGKDSRCFAQAGAQGVLICSAEKLAFIERHQPEPALEQLLRNFFENYDLMLVEGYRSAAYPKIEVCPQNGRLPSVEDIRKRKIIAFVTNAQSGPKIPRFDYDESEQIAQFIVDNAVAPPISIK